MPQRGPVNPDERSVEDRIRLIEVRLWIISESMHELTKLVNQLVQPRREKTA